MVKKMNSDLSKELLRKINKSFTLSYQKSEKIIKLLSAIKKKDCDFLKAMDYAEEVGKILAEAYMKNLSSDVLPDGKMYYDIASEILNPTLENNYGLISSYVCGAMDVMNKKAGINAKARKPSYNADKTLGLIKKVSEAEYFDDVKKYLNEPVITNALSIVDEGVRTNADLHYNMGYKPVIVRRASFGCCPWCRGLAGVYNYEDVKDTGNDVFRRHANCRCKVIYDPRNGDGKVQDVHSREIIELNTPSKVREEKAAPKLPNGTEDVTKVYLNQATPGKGVVENAKSVTIKGRIFYVNEVNKIKHKNNEVEVAEWLKKIFGGEVLYLPEIQEANGVKCSDYLWNGEFWDLKTLKGTSMHTLFHAVEEKEGQANNFIFDLTKTGLNDVEIMERLDEIYRKPKTSYVNTIIVKRMDELVIVIKRK